MYDRKDVNQKMRNNHNVTEQNVLMGLKTLHLYGCLHN